MTETTPGFRLAAQEYDPAVPVDRLSEHPGNPNEGDLDLLAESLDRFGFVGGIVVHKASGEIIAGNHRYREAVARGAETLPAFLVDLDPEEARAYLATDNEATRRGMNNHEKLLALLAPMKALPPGFTRADVDDLRRLLHPPDLGELAAGAPEEFDLWPMLRFRVSPEDRERFYALTDAAEDKTDTGRLVFLLDGG